MIHGHDTCRKHVLWTKHFLKPCWSFSYVNGQDPTYLIPTIFIPTFLYNPSLPPSPPLDLLPGGKSLFQWSLSISNLFLFTIDSAILCIFSYSIGPYSHHKCSFDCSSIYCLILAVLPLKGGMKDTLKQVSPNPYLGQISPLENVYLTLGRWWCQPMATCWGGINTVNF